MRALWVYRKVIAIVEEDSTLCHASTIPSWLPFLPLNKKPVGVRLTGKPQVVKTTKVTGQNLDLTVGPWLRALWAYRKVIAVADEDSAPCHASTIPSWIPFLPF